MQGVLRRKNGYNELTLSVTRPCSHVTRPGIGPEVTANHRAASRSRPRFCGSGGRQRPAPMLDRGHGHKRRYAQAPHPDEWPLLPTTTYRLNSEAFARRLAGPRGMMGGEGATEAP